MRPGKVVYRHEIIVDLDDAEMVSLAEKEIERCVSLDIEHNESQDNINQIQLTMRETLSYDGIEKRIETTKKMLSGLNDDGED